MNLHAIFGNIFLVLVSCSYARKLFSLNKTLVYIHVPVFLKKFLKQMHLIYGTNQELLLYACDYLHSYQEILLQIISTS